MLFTQNGYLKQYFYEELFKTEKWIFPTLKVKDMKDIRKMLIGNRDEELKPQQD